MTISVSGAMRSWPRASRASGPVLSGHRLWENTSAQYHPDGPLLAIHALGCPLLVGHSRKAFIGKLIGDKTADRTAGTVGVRWRWRFRACKSFASTMWPRCGRRSCCSRRVAGSMACAEWRRAARRYGRSPELWAARYAKSPCPLAERVDHLQARVFTAGDFARPFRLPTRRASL